MRRLPASSTWCPALPDRSTWPGFEPSPAAPTTRSCPLDGDSSLTVISKANGWGKDFNCWRIYWRLAKYQYVPWPYGDLWASWSSHQKTVGSNPARVSGANPTNTNPVFTRMLFVICWRIYRNISLEKVSCHHTKTGKCTQRKKHLITFLTATCFCKIGTFLILTTASKGIILKPWYCMFGFKPKAHTFLYLIQVHGWTPFHPLGRREGRQPEAL